MTRHSFTIFISGSCRDAGQAVSNLRFLCERYLKNNHKVRMIDVELYPGAAEEYGIMVTPTLIKNCEHEEFRVVGDLRDAEEVFQVLGFDSSTDEPESIAQLHPTTTPSVRREGNQ